MTDILVVKCGSLGDVVRTSYILPGLCEKYGDAAVHWLTGPDCLDLLRFNPYVSALHVMPVAEALRERTFDLVISLDDEVEILDQITGITHRRLIGACLRDGKAWYSEDSSEWFDMGLISRFGRRRADELKKVNRRAHHQIFGDMLGIDIASARFFNSELIEKRMLSRFDLAFFNIGINPGAGSRWPSKELPVDETIALVGALLGQRIEGKETRVYLLGGRQEAERNAAFAAALASERLIETGETYSLLEFAALIRCCDYLITSDSLALHLAISQGVRNLSYYAPTSADEIGTFGSGTKVVSLSDDYCSYRPDADNSSLTAARIMETMSAHLGLKNPPATDGI